MLTFRRLSSNIPNSVNDNSHIVHRLRLSRSRYRMADVTYYGCDGLKIKLG
jgi:hypothetical protein